MMRRLKEPTPVKIVSLMLPEELHRTLRQIARDEGISLSALIRAIVQQAIRRRKAERRTL